MTVGYIDSWMLGLFTGVDIKYQDKNINWNESKTVDVGGVEKVVSGDAVDDNNYTSITVPVQLIIGGNWNSGRDGPLGSENYVKFRSGYVFRLQDLPALGNNLEVQSHGWEVGADFRQRLGDHLVLRLGGSYGQDFDASGVYGSTDQRFEAPDDKTARHGTAYLGVSYRDFVGLMARYQHDESFMRRPEGSASFENKHNQFMLLLHLGAPAKTYSQEQFR